MDRDAVRHVHGSAPAKRHRSRLRPAQEQEPVIRFASRRARERASREPRAPHRPQSSSRRKARDDFQSRVHAQALAPLYLMTPPRGPRVSLSDAPYVVPVSPCLLGGVFSGSLSQSNASSPRSTALASAAPCAAIFPNLSSQSDEQFVREDAKCVANAALCHYIPVTTSEHTARPTHLLSVEPVGSHPSTLSAAIRLDGIVAKDAFIAESVSAAPSARLALIAGIEPEHVPHRARHLRVVLAPLVREGALAHRLESRARRRRRRRRRRNKTKTRARRRDARATVAAQS